MYMQYIEFHHYINLSGLIHPQMNPDMNGKILLLKDFFQPEVCLVLRFFFFGNLLRLMSFLGGFNHRDLGAFN